MYRDGIGHIQLAQQVCRIHGGALVKANGNQLTGGVDILNDAHIAVEDAGTCRAVVLFPDHVVVVLRLHHPVTGAEHNIAPHLLPLTGSRRIQRRLQRAVQVHRTHLALAGRRQHLYLFHRHAHILRQTGAAQFHHCLHQPVRCAAAQEEEIALIALQRRLHTQIHRVSIADNGGLLRLTENLPQHHRGDSAAAQHIAQHIAGTHRRQLVGVSHHHKAAARAQRCKKGSHQL